MPTYFYTREDEFSIQAEVTYGVKPGSPAAGDFFKHTSGRAGIARETNAYYRDRDNDFGKASVTNLQIGRQKTKVSIDADLIPSGNAATPTAPDTKNLWKALFGVQNTLTAHTTTAAGSAGVSLVLAVGGGAASGIRVGGGDLIAVDVSAAAGIEVRRVVSRATDTVTVDRAFTTDPAAARAVYVGTTYQFSVNTLTALHLWLWNGAVKYRYPGLAIMDGEINCNFNSATPVAVQKFGGECAPEAANSDSRPGSPTTSGNPLLPSAGKIWLGATKIPIVSAGFKVNNGMQLRNAESDQLSPTAITRTGNNARYQVEQTLETFFTDSMQTFYDNARTLTAIDTIVQLGTAVGNIVAWTCPRWQPMATTSETNQELGVKLAGRALGVSGDDEVSLAFI